MSNSRSTEGKGSPKIPATPEEQNSVRRANKARKHKSAKGGLHVVPLFTAMAEDRRNARQERNEQRDNALSQRFFANTWSHIQAASKKYGWSDQDLLEAKAMYTELCLGEFAEILPRFEVYNEVTRRFATAVYFDRGNTPKMYGQTYTSFEADYASAVKRFAKSPVGAMQDA